MWSGHRSSHCVWIYFVHNEGNVFMLYFWCVRAGNSNIWSENAACFSQVAHSFVRWEPTGKDNMSKTVMIPVSVLLITQPSSNKIFETNEPMVIKLRRSNNRHDGWIFHLWIEESMAALHANQEYIDRVIFNIAELCIEYSSLGR